MSGDYSRKTFKPINNYSGVLMQQGRVQLDADNNELQAINQRRQRAQTIDSIGRAVVPIETHDGFKVELNEAGLNIFPGRMYVDGLLAENHGESPQEFYSPLHEERGASPLLYHEQPYFPNAQDVEPLPNSGVGIAYLDVWQREITYINQPNLIEPAVGLDTTTRLQTVWQVKFLPIDNLENETLECHAKLKEWDQLVAPSAARLSNAIVATENEEDVCLIPSEGGYRALENRLYRVEVHSGGGFGEATFKWSRHNASIETRVLQINGLVLSVAQAQWDAVRGFNVGDWIEVTDDIREFSGESGDMRLITDVDYAQNLITLESVLTAGDFPTDINNVTEQQRNTRIRHWDQKKDIDGSGVSLVTTEPLYLEDGIQVHFEIDGATELSGSFKSGDYWLFYARSATASIEVLEKAPSRGIHHHYARLAILNFPSGQVDCREHWPPDFGNSCCCTVTVGDNENSHGQFNSIQDAIDNLPLAGGKVCIQPGLYSEHIVIKDKHNISIEGCSQWTKLISKEGDSFINQPVINIESSSNIELKGFEIYANTDGAGIDISSGDFISNDNGKKTTIKDITIQDVVISSGLKSAVRCEGVNTLNFIDNTIQMRNEQSIWPGIFASGENLSIINNKVLINQNKNSNQIINETTVLSKEKIIARGGIQIGGMSQNVLIEGNYICGGIGDGISLGSMSYVDENEEPLIKMIALLVDANDECDNCAPPSIKISNKIKREHIDSRVHTAQLRPGIGIEEILAIREDDNSNSVISSGDLYNVNIRNNVIKQMGRNGVGVIGFFNLEESDEFISIENLTISNNQIKECLNTVLPAISAEQEDDMGYGAICLADVLNLKIHDNDIINNGSNQFDPVCGVYVLHGEGVEICDNRIVGNDDKLSTNANTVLKAGPRSGIHIVYAITPTTSISLTSKLGNLPRQNGVPAAKVHNNVVVQSIGRALTIDALGPLVVSDNQFTSRGVIKGSESAKISTVSILNLGMSNEFYSQLSGFEQLAKRSSNLDALNLNLKANTSNGVTFRNSNLDDYKLGRYLANGNVMFVSNQVVLDDIDTIKNQILSAVTILSLDDISFNNNQCDYSLLEDLLLFPNVFIAPSLRICDNRFKESFSGALFSVLAFGMMNTTTNNQATHCIISKGLTGMEVVKDNIEILGVLTGGGDESICARFKSLLGA